MHVQNIELNVVFSRQHHYTYPKFAGKMYFLLHLCSTTSVFTRHFSTQPPSQRLSFLVSHDNWRQYFMHAVILYILSQMKKIY